MKEKRLLKKAYRCQKISHRETHEVMICLYKDIIYIKVDSVYNTLKPRITHYETCMTFIAHYNRIVEVLRSKGVSKELSERVKKVLVQWRKAKYFSFDDAGIITINGGHSNDNK